MKLRIISKKYLVDSAFLFPTKSILRHMVFTQTTRHLMVKCLRIIFVIGLEFIAKF